MINKLMLIIQLFLIFYSCKAIAGNNDEEIEWQLLKYRYIMEQAIEQSADSVNIEKASDAAYNAFLQEINQDSRYFNKIVMKRLLNREKNVSVGIGVEYIIADDTVKVLKDETGRMKSGSSIIKIDNKTVTGMNYKQVNALISGEPDTDIIVENIYEGSTEKLIYTRKEYKTNAVTSAFDINKSGKCYLRLDRFSEESAAELKDKLDELNNKNELNYIILDLRGNSGGLIEEVISSLSLFFDDNTFITEVKSKSEEYAKKYYTDEDGIYKNIPIAVLIDSTSKSGSEMFAAAIQEYDRGITLGSQTYGKGSVQKGFQMKDSTAFRLTVGYYYTPLGRKIEISDREEEVIISGKIDEKVKKQIQKMQKTDIKYVKTNKGRVFFETGGIKPDIQIFDDTLTILTKVLKKRGLFFKFVFDNYNILKNLTEDYNNYQTYASNFEVSSELLQKFAELSIQNNIWNREMFEKDKKRIIINMKAAIAYIFWSEEAYYYQLMNYDKLVIEAVRHYNDSINLLK